MTLDDLRAALRLHYRQAPADTGQCPTCGDTGWTETAPRTVARCPLGCRPRVWRGEPQA